jgi:hypothetical protein
LIFFIPLEATLFVLYLLWQVMKKISFSDGKKAMCAIALFAFVGLVFPV